MKISRENKSISDENYSNQFILKKQWKSSVFFSSLILSSSSEHAEIDFISIHIIHLSISRLVICVRHTSPTDSHHRRCYLTATLNIFFSSFYFAFLLHNFNSNRRETFEAHTQCKWSYDRKTLFCNRTAVLAVYTPPIHIHTQSYTQEKLNSTSKTTTIVMVVGVVGLIFESGRIRFWYE